VQRRCSIRGDIVQLHYMQVLVGAQIVTPLPLCTLAAPQPHSLAVFLELGDELISLSHNVIVLLVLVVWPVGLDDTFPSHAINGTWDSLCGDELCKVAGRRLAKDEKIWLRITYRSKKSTETPKSFAILSRPTTR